MCVALAACSTHATDEAAARAPTSWNPSPTTPTVPLRVWDGKAAFEPLGEPGVGGRVTSVAVDPHDGERFMAAGDMLGIAYSNDSGATWDAPTAQSANEIGSITFHPQREGEIWAGSMSGPLVSRDGGETWQLQRVGMPEPSSLTYTAPIEVVLVDPDDGDVLVAFGGSQREWPAADDPTPMWGAVWRSEDAGDSWTLHSEQLLGTNITAASFLPGAPAGLVAAVKGMGVARSDDGGRTWKVSSQGLPSAEVSDLAPHPEDPSQLVVVVDSAERDGTVLAGGVYRSDNGGRTFDASMEGIDLAPPEDREVTSRFLEVARSQSDPDVLVTGDVGFWHPRVYRSVDGGRTWRTVLRKGDVDTAYSAGPGAEALAISPLDPSVILVGTSEHLFRSADGGRTWQDIGSRSVGAGRFAGTGFSGLVATDVAFDPVRPGRLLLSAMDGGAVLLSDDAGASWARPVENHDPWGGGTDVEVTPNGTTAVVLGQSGSFNGIAVSHGADGAWEVRSGAGVGLPELGTSLSSGALATDVTSPSRLLAAIGGSLYRSDDDGGRWEQVLDAAAVDGVRDVAVRSDGRCALATGRGVVLLEAGCVGTPEPLAGGPPSATGVREAAAVLYAWNRDRVHGGLWRVDGDGVVALSSNGEVADVAVSPHDDRLVVVALQELPFHDNAVTDGLMVSVDGGGQWRAIGEGLAVRRVSAVAFDPQQPGRLLLGTIGRGFWEADLSRALDALAH